MDTNYRPEGLQLQFWSPALQEYVPVPNAPTDPDIARKMQPGRHWRICKPDRALTVPPPPGFFGLRAPFLDFFLAFAINVSYRDCRKITA